MPVPFLLTTLLLAACSSLPAAELPAPAQPAESAINAAAPEAPFCLWYRQPATNWNEALPLGNGRLGAMVFGTPDKERLQLNEESLWAGCPVQSWPPDFPKHLTEVRRLLFAGRNAEAQTYGVEHLTATPTSFRSYEPLADWWLDPLCGAWMAARLFEVCPPFQIDGNFGGCAGLEKMLRQSHERVEVRGQESAVLLDLLPVWPKAWASGSVRGLRARGGFEVDIAWQNGKVTNYRIRSKEPGEVKLRVNGEAQTIESGRL